jgi:hypothetical protein
MKKLMINKLYKIKNYEILEVEIISQTDKTITIRDWLTFKLHKQKDIYRLNNIYFQSYDKALDVIIKTIIKKKEEINKINNEINYIFTKYILSSDDRKKFKWILY